MGSGKRETYGFNKKFERVVALLCTTNPRFYGKIAAVIEVEKFKDALTRLLLTAAKQIAKDVGKGPSSDVVVLQRLQRLLGEGKVTQEELDAAIDFYLDAPKPPPEDEVLAELVPVLKRQMQAAAVRQAMDEYARKGDFDSVIRTLSKARAIGTHDVSLGLRLGPDALREIKRLQHLDKLAFGIPELDMAIDGGLPRGCVNLWIGGFGAGKSMALSHRTAYAVSLGYFALVVTLEISEAAWQARVIANLLDVPINSILTEDQQILEDRLVDECETLGVLRVKEFTANVTTIPDIWQWVLEAEEEEGLDADLVVVDYIDKVKSHNPDDRNAYASQGTVMEGFRTRIHASGKWGDTASQGVRRAGKDKNRRLDGDDGADSQNKIRVTDLSITLNPDAEQEQLLYFVAKNRYGRAGMSVGPLPHDWGNGSMIVR